MESKRLTANYRLELPHLGPAFVFFLTTLGVAVFFLFSTTPFQLGAYARVLGLALLTVPTFGWLIVQIAIPDIRSTGIRLALIVLVGLVVSMHLGFFLGAVGVQGAYLWACILSAGLSVGLYILRQRQVHSAWHSDFLTDARIFLNNPTVWIVAGLGMLSIVAIVPLLAPLVRVTSALSVDYSYVDKFFQMARAQILSNGAPEWTAAETGGMKPLVYPDYYEFWIGTLIRWSRLETRPVYLLYVPILQVFMNVLVSYALGKTLTGSTWGGFLAVVLCNIAFFPNPYDSNFFLRNIDTDPELVMGRFHFIPWRATLTYGLAWTMLSGTVLCLALYKKHARSGTGVGLVTIAALLVAGLLRVRSNYFLILGPLFVMFVLYWIFKLRDWRLFWVLGIFGAFVGAIYLESIDARYNLHTSALALRYGVYGKFAIALLPQQVRSIFELIPAPIQPITTQIGMIVLRMFGVVYGTLFVYEIVRLARRRISLTTPRVFLLAALGILFVQVLFIVRADERYDAVGGEWGSQAMTLAIWLAVLFAIMPLFHIARATVRRFHFVQQHFYALSVPCVVLLTLVSYRGADAALHDQTIRAYPLRTSELQAYAWLKQNAPPRAIVAAHPDYQVNAKGETIAQTNFLSGMTEHPVYLERMQNYFTYTEENSRRREQLRGLFKADSPEIVRELLKQMPFDYLLVYPEIPPKIDLDCCMKLKKDGIPAIYTKLAP